MENSTITLLLPHLNASSCGLVLEDLKFHLKKMTAYHQNTVGIKK